MAKKTVDHSVYPDVEHPPSEFSTMEARADYVHRVCGAWDYGILPTSETFELFATWRTVFDRFPISGSPAYHAFRAWFGWPAVPGAILQARYERIDARFDREDPCAKEV